MNTNDKFYTLPLLHHLVFENFARKVQVDSYRNILTDAENIPFLLDSLVAFLPKHPNFYPKKDFVEMYHYYLTRISDFAIARKKGGASRKCYLSKKYRPYLQLNLVNGILFNKDKRLHTFIHLLDSVAKIPFRELPRHTSEMQGLYYAYKVALALLKKGAVIPQLYTLNNGNRHTVVLRWLPLMANTEVNKVLQKLALLLPTMVQINNQWLSGLQQAVALCSALLEVLISKARIACDSHPVSQLFFKVFYNEVNFSHNDTYHIQQWLSSLQFWQDDYTPLFILEVPDNNDNKNNPDTEKVKKVIDDDFLLASIAIADKYNSDLPTSLFSILKNNELQNQYRIIMPIIDKMVEIYPPLQSYLDNNAKYLLRIPINNMPELFSYVFPAMNALGIKILLPKELEKTLKPEVSIKISSKKAENKGAQSFFSFQDILSFNWEVMINQKRISIKEFEQIIEKNQTIVRFNHQFILLDKKKVDEIREFLTKPPKLSQIELLSAVLTNEYNNTPVALDQSAQDLLYQFQHSEPIAVPDALNAELRPYQYRGFNWLYRNIRLGIGSIIADDMGLGKTLQVISTLLKLKEEGFLTQNKVLIVVPSSLLINWQKEIMRFAPLLISAVYHGKKRELTLENVDIIITTYGMVRSSQALFNSIMWAIVIIDEAQNIKNPGSVQTKSIKSLSAYNFIAMSGTPIENHLSEYWSIMDFTNHGLLGGLTAFNREYSAPIQNKKDEKAIERFKKITSPFLLRRLKSDQTIIQDLPDKIEQDQYCELSPQQIALYASIVREGLAVIGAESNTFERQGLVLKMILSLKQICNHPAQYLKNDKIDIKYSGKGERFLELLQEIYENQQKVIIFTQFRSMGEILQAWIAKYFKLPCEFLHGGIDYKKRDEMVEQFQNNPEQWALILSLKAGGAGLNLTAASNVIHYDLWWNAAVEAQATDRAYRIGQTQNVQIHRLINRGTFEEKINSIVQFKKELADITINPGEQWIGNLTNEELKEIFNL